MKQSQPADESPEPNISRISLGGGVAGLIVTVAVLGIFLVGLPPTRWFLGVSLVAGVAVALLLKFTARDR